MPKKPIEYDLQSLREGITKCDVNVGIFEQAIAGERATQKQYRHMISVLEEKYEREKRHPV